MSFFKNLISSAIGTFIALGLLFVFMLVFLAGSVALMDEEGDAFELEKNTVLEFDMGLPIQDREPQSFSFASALEIDPEAYGLNTIIPAIENAAKDDFVSGISIQNISAMGGISNMYTLRKALVAFKESGKFIYAYGDYYSQLDYYLASVADSIWL